MAANDSNNDQSQTSSESLKRKQPTNDCGGDGSVFNVSVSGFIDSISPMKRAKKSNIEYFDGIIQEGDKYHRFVCYSPAKKKLFQEAVDKQQAVQCSPVKKFTSSRKGFEGEVTISDSCIVKQTNVDFKPCAFSSTTKSDVVPVSLLQNCNNKDIVSVQVHIQSTGCPIIPVLLPYKSEPLDKKEVKANDETGTVKIALWGAKIKEVDDDGTYLVANAVVRKSNTEVYLTTNMSTVITQVKDAKITPSTTVLNNLQLKKLKFPPENVHAIKVLSFCTSCNKNRQNEATNKMIFKCSVCQSTKMAKNVRRNVETKLDFLQDGKIVTISLFGPQVELYFQRDIKQIPGDADEISLSFLQDTSTVLLSNEKNLCIGFE